MKTIVFLILLVEIFASCSGRPDCTAPSFADRRITEMSKGTRVSYVHHIRLGNYHNKCFSEYNFMRTIRHYLDTNTIMKPVASVCFHFGDSRDWHRDRQTEVLSVFFTDSSLNRKMPTVSYISIGPDNKYELDFMYLLPADSAYLINK